MNYIKLIFVVIILLTFSCKKDSDDDNLDTVIDDNVSTTESKLSDGYVLYSFMGDKAIQLIDTNGNEVKSWAATHRTSGGYYLSENKTLLRLGSSPAAGQGVFASGGAVGGFIEELDDNSNIIWSIQRDSDTSTFHHDFKEIDENTIIALSWKFVTYNGIDCWNEKILIIDKSTNSVQWEWDAINDGGFIPQTGANKDLFHFNSVDYKDGVILISSRTKNELYLINKETKAITATLSANGALSGQHDASLLDNGNILVFNNNAGNNKSEILELSRTDDLVWSYSNDFYSDHISGVSRLQSGNTIICSGTEGRFIEVTETGEEVWDFTPDTSTASNSTEIFKIRKYSEY